MLGRISKEEQRLFINSKQVLGIQNLNVNYDLPIDEVKSLGMQTVVFSNTRPVTAEITVNKLMVDQDNFLPFTGDVFFSGYVEYKDKYFAFNSGILNNYSISCGVGEIPSLNVALTVLGDFGGNIPKSSSTITQNDIKIMDYADIEIDLNDFKINRLQNFQITIDTNRNILYNLNSAYPFQVISNPPVVSNIDFGMKIDDYQIKNIRDLLCTYQVTGVNITFKNYCDPNGSSVLSFNYNEAIFLGETYQASVNESAIVNLKYKAFSTPTLSKPIPTQIPNSDARNLTNTINF